QAEARVVLASRRPQLAARFEDENGLALARASGWYFALRSDGKRLGVEGVVTTDADGRFARPFAGTFAALDGRLRFECSSVGRFLTAEIACATAIDGICELGTMPMQP